MSKLSEVMQVVGELIALSDPQDTITTIDGDLVKIEYVGRGGEWIGIYGDSEQYLDGVKKRLTQIKNYILECAA